MHAAWSSARQIWCTLTVNSHSTLIGTASGSPALTFVAGSAKKHFLGSGIGKRGCVT
jgi:hypothetical protein